MSSLAVEAHAPSRSGVWWVVGPYALFAGLWIGLSDAALSSLLTDPKQLALAGTLKGWAFVGVTAVLLYDLIRRLIDRQQQAFERERAAQQLQDSTLGLLQALAQSSPDLIFAKDRAGRYLLFNREAERVTRTLAAQVLGCDDTAIFAPAQAAMIRANDERVMAQDRPETFEEEIDTAVGRITYLATKGPLHDPQGRVVGIFGISRDITERLAAQERLRVSELRYRLAAAQGQVWDWDVASGRVDFPAAFWKQLGYPPSSDRPVTARFEALLHPEDLERWRHALREHLARRAPYKLEYRARDAGGDWRWFHTQGQAVWDAEGHATYMAGTTFEITQRKRAEAALHASEAYRRSLIEQLADAVLLVDRERRIVDANPQALSMLGYGREALLQLSITDLLPDSEHHRIDTEVAEMIAGEPLLTEWELVRKDGSRFPAEVSLRMLDGPLFLAVIRDVTARRESEKALLAFQFELSELTQRLLAQEKTTTQRVAQALHDNLGQTLAVARLTLDACITTYAATMPESMEEQTDRMSLLLDQAMREVRQVLADLRPPLLEDQGLEAALDNEIRSRAIAGRSTDVLLEVADEAANRRWPSDVEYGAFMVAREAIANAWQHAEASMIRVVLGGDAGTLRLDVIDDGKGIPPSLIHGRPGHLGLVGMRERSIAIGARFAVDAAPAGGTRVTLHWRARPP